MPVQPGRQYVIKNAGQPFYLNDKDWGQSHGALVILWNAVNQDNNFTNSWYVFRVDGDRDECWIANKHSGFLLHPADNSTAEYRHLDQAEPDASDNVAAALRWRAIEQGTSGTYQLLNVHSGLYAHPYHDGGAGSEIEQRSWLSGNNTMLWKLEQQRVIDQVANLQPGEDSIGDIDRLTSMNRPKEATSEVLVGQTAIPFVAIKDMTRPRQAETSPWYLLKRYGFWQRVDFQERDSTSSHEYECKTWVGLTTGNSTSIEETTSIQVTAEASFAFKGFSAGLSTTISRELKVTKTSWSEGESGKEDIYRTTFPAIGGSHSRRSPQPTALVRQNRVAPCPPDLHARLPGGVRRPPRAGAGMAPRYDRTEVRPHCAGHTRRA